MREPWSAAWLLIVVLVLAALATQAFGWTSDAEQQLDAARAQFPGVSY